MPSWTVCSHHCVRRTDPAGKEPDTSLHHPAPPAAPSGTAVPRQLWMLCCKGPGCVSPPDLQLFLYPGLVIPALTVLFVADLLFLCISKEMQIWNVIRRMRHYSQCLPNSLASVSASIIDRSWSSFNRQFSGSSEHPCRKKSPRILIHISKCCLSFSPLKMSLLIQGSFPCWHASLVHTSM